MDINNIENNKKSIKILLIVAISLFIIIASGATYALFTTRIDVTNGIYNTATHCLVAEYGTDNGDNTHDLTGTLFPSSSSANGLKGRVSVKISNECNLTAKGTLKLHINNTTSSKLTTPAESYCALRRTGEKLTEYTTKSACEEDSNHHRWYGYGDPYCESSATLQRLVNYDNQTDCNSNSGVWKTGGSPLKYAVYDNAAGTGTPLSVGTINSTDINNNIDIYTNFTIDNQLKYYYIYIWLDGYLSDESYTELPFAGTISASVYQQGNQQNSSPNYVYTVNIGPSTVTIGQPISVTTYQSPEAAMAALKTAGDGTTNYPFFLAHVLGANDDVSESYVGFVVTPAMASANPGMTAGTYYLKGGDNGAAYNDNKTVLTTAFGSNTTYCEEENSGGVNYFECTVSGLYAYADDVGYADAEDDAGSSCGVSGADGASSCYINAGGS